MVKMLQSVVGYFSRSKPQNSELNDSLSSWVGNRLKWCPTSIAALEEAETKILSFIRKPFNIRHVNISEEGSKTQQIRTLSINDDDEECKRKTPLVLLHGLGSGIGLWVQNIDSLSEDRPLYAIDILGFGLSSRPSFSGNADDVENRLVDSIEQWCRAVSLDKFILLGHSMGGYLASAYAIKYPDRIQHLILADPWGFPKRDVSKEQEAIQKAQLPFWFKAIRAILQYFNPLTGLRIAGPWGPNLVKTLRPDILQKFEGTVDDVTVVADYIYHCNAQKPSGETAFKSMSQGLGWARSPMINRFNDLREDIPITFIYGSRSWINSSSGYEAKEMKPDSVTVKQVIGSGHHVYADRPDVFNNYVKEICSDTDHMILSGSNSSSFADITYDEQNCPESILSDKSHAAVQQTLTSVAT